MFIVLALLVLALVVISYGVGIYNRLISLRNRYKNAYAQIDVQLKRRYDLIPNLVETAKAYLNHERQTLEAVINGRNQAMRAQQQAAQTPGNPKAMKELMGAEGVLTDALVRFNAVVEAYPDLKANQTMSQLSEELSSTENKIAFARQAYNDAVMGYNISRETFPNSLIASPFRFDAAELFEVTNKAEREAPKVAFA